MKSLGSFPFTTAVTLQGPAVTTGIGKVGGLSLLAKLTTPGGGTSVKVWVQTSLDDGATWFDIACFAFGSSTAVKYANIDGYAQVAPASLTTGSLADNTAVHGLIGDQLRFVITTAGTFNSGSTVEVPFWTR